MLRWHINYYSRTFSSMYSWLLTQSSDPLFWSSSKPSIGGLLWSLSSFWRCRVKNCQGRKLKHHRNVCINWPEVVFDFISLCILLSDTKFSPEVPQIQLILSVLVWEVMNKNRKEFRSNSLRAISTYSGRKCSKMSLIKTRFYAETPVLV